MEPVSEADRISVVEALAEEAVASEAAVAQEIGVFGLVSALFFLLILTFGLAYAWRKGALEWK